MATRKKQPDKTGATSDDPIAKNLKALDRLYQSHKRSMDVTERIQFGLQVTQLQTLISIRNRLRELTEKITK